MTELERHTVWRLILVFLACFWGSVGVMVMSLF